MNFRSTTARPARLRTLVTAILTALFVTALISSGAQSAHAAPRMLTPEQIASDKPKVVMIDTTTGKVTEAWFVTTGTVTPMISQHSICNTSDSCYVSGQTPYAHQGFYGTPGTKTGSWPQRSRIDSVSRTVRGCWTSGCSGVLGPYTQAFLNPRVTGTSFTIY